MGGLPTRGQIDSDYRTEVEKLKTFGEVRRDDTLYVTYDYKDIFHTSVKDIIDDGEYISVFPHVHFHELIVKPEDTCLYASNVYGEGFITTTNKEMVDECVRHFQYIINCLEIGRETEEL